jgi:hypothetical protein
MSRLYTTLAALATSKLPQSGTRGGAGGLWAIYITPQFCYKTLTIASKEVTNHAQDHRGEDIRESPG